MKPTILSPWYVVMRLSDPLIALADGQPPVYFPEWFVASDESDDPWTRDRTQAFMFNSLHSANRVSLATKDAFVVAVPDEDTYKEYRKA